MRETRPDPKHKHTIMQILFLLVLIYPLQLNAEPKVYETIEEYSVISKSVDNLLSNLNKASPIRQHGSIYHAYTDTYVEWNYKWRNQKGSCKLNRVETTVRITYTLPHLLKTSSSRQALNIWNSYYPALVLHEKGHGTIAINAAKQIEKTLLGLPIYTNCDSLNREANLKAHDILARFRLKQANYDTRTEHGKTQGANLELYLYRKPTKNTK